MEAKIESRRHFLEIRKNLSDNKRAFKSQKIMEQLIADPHYLKAYHILLYRAFGDEVETNLLFEDAKCKGKQIYTPKVINSQTSDMEFFETQNEKTGYMGILEPSEQGKAFISNNSLKKTDAVAIIPGVAFDYNGYRLGYGKGFYDKYLKEKSIYTIGICFEEQLTESLPIEENDIKLNCIYTDKRRVLS